MFLHVYVAPFDQFLVSAAKGRRVNGRRRTSIILENVYGPFLPGRTRQPLLRKVSDTLQIRKIDNLDEHSLISRSLFDVVAGVFRFLLAAA